MSQPAPARAQGASRRAGLVVALVLAVVLLVGSAAAAIVWSGAAPGRTSTPASIDQQVVPDGRTGYPDAMWRMHEWMHGTDPGTGQGDGGSRYPAPQPSPSPSF